MPSSESTPIVVSGIGVTSAIGQGRHAFIDSLLAGRHRFDVMRRPGRQLPGNSGEGCNEFIGAEIGELHMPAVVPASVLRNASWPAQVALATIAEAWDDAGLDEVDPVRIGLIVGGSNVQQRDTVLAQEQYRDRIEYLRPTYGITFMDSDLCGLCTEVFGIRGPAFTAGAASASGQLATIQAIEAVRGGQVDVCIALGSLMDLSYFECQGLRSLGAMGSDHFAKQPALACRPFDTDHDGFIYGEACGAVVIEREGRVRSGGRTPYAAVLGWSMASDGNRNPNPSVDGEMAVIRQALSKAEVRAGMIDYVNPHGTASRIGDETELDALRRSGLSEAYVNTTKSIVGHGLSAAGIVELIAIMLQMEAGRLHPSRNLDRPLDANFRWVGSMSVEHRINCALNMSMGFGGVNTALCLRRC